LNPKVQVPGDRPRSGQNAVTVQLTSFEEDLVQPGFYGISPIQSGASDGIGPNSVSIQQLNSPSVTITVIVNSSSAIPEYPLGLPVLAVFMILAYCVIRRKTRNPKNYLTVSLPFQPSSFVAWKVCVWVQWCAHTHKNHGSILVGRTIDTTHTEVGGIEVERENKPLTLIQNGVRSTNIGRRTGENEGRVPLNLYFFVMLIVYCGFSNMITLQLYPSSSSPHFLEQTVLRWQTQHYGN
jgi:hypothetical protein